MKAPNKMVKTRSEKNHASISMPTLVLANSQEINQALEDISDDEVNSPTDYSKNVDLSADVQDLLESGAANEDSETIRTIENIKNELDDLDYVLSDSEDEVQELDLLPGRNANVIHRGPKFSKIWDDFVTIKNKHGKITSNKCKSCGDSVSARANRMESHRSKCKSVQAKPSASGPLGIQQSNVPPSVAPKITERGEGNLKQNTLMSFVKKVDEKKRADLDMALGRMIFACNLPFHVVENSYFQEFVRKLNPAYVLPSHETVGGRILEDVYNETQSRMKQDLDGKKVVLSQDGWSTNQSSPVISHCLSTENNAYFLEAIQTQDNKKDADYCANLWFSAKAKAETDYNCQVVGAVTDNCNTMKATLAKINLEDPSIVTYGCQSHLMNLVGKHFTRGDIQDKVTSVQLFMKNHYYTSEKLKSLGIPRPVLAGGTRWNSQIDSFISYQQNQTKYIDLLRELRGKNLNPPDKKKIEDTLEIVSEQGLYEDVQEMVQSLAPLALNLDRLQGDSSRLADAVRSWLDIEETLPERFRTDGYYRGIVKDALTDCALAAYVLDPKYAGAKLTKERMEKALLWLGKLSPTLVVYATELQQRSSRHFMQSLLNDTVISEMSPVAWWKANIGLKAEAVGIIENLMILPSSTGAIERSFSVLKLILTDLRNRLGITKASKLCSIYQTFRMNEDQLEKRRMKRKRKLSLE